MLVKQLETHFRQGVLRFLWRQWSQLGVAGDIGFRDRWLIDPEALLLLTLDIGRYDPRLFDEVIDWCLRNRRWLSIQRLKNLADKWATGEVRTTLAAFGQYMADHDASPRWNAIAGLSPAASGQEIPLFLDPAGGGYLPTGKSRDPSFASRGVIRSPVRPRGMSVAVPTDVPTNLLFKLRAVFGLGVRPEALGYLMARSPAHSTELAMSIGYSQSSVHDTMTDIAQSGLVSVQETGREKVFAADRSRWRQFLGLRGNSPVWVDWPRVFAALSTLDCFFALERFDEMSDYLLYSRTRSLLDSLRVALAGCGLPTRVGDDPKFLAGTVHAIVSALNGRPIAKPGTIGPRLVPFLRRPPA